jgi:DNA-binding HxlR family transcriptional regulator
MGKKHKEKSTVDPLHMTRDIVGCKWSLHVLDAIAGGHRRPGRIHAAISGISTKVLNERLRKLQRYGLAERKVFPVAPPRVEYRLTAKGRAFAKAIRSLRTLRPSESPRVSRDAVYAHHAQPPSRSA